MPAKTPLASSQCAENTCPCTPRTSRDIPASTALAAIECGNRRVAWQVHAPRTERRDTDASSMGHLGALPAVSLIACQ
jgi:hypothetical protein